MDFLKKASYYLSNNQNLRRGIFISVAIIFLLVVVLFNSDIQDLLKGPGAGKAADGPIESENNWSTNWDDINVARSNAKMIDVMQNGERWIYLIGGTKKIYNSEYYDADDWDNPQTGERLSLVSSVERIKINNDGSPMVDIDGMPTEYWEETSTMNFGHAEFGLLEHNNYIYVITGDIHMPTVDDPSNEFPMLYSTIERLSLIEADPQWEVVALVTGVNFYPEVKIYNNQLHIVGGIYGNPFNGATYNLFGGYGAKDPLVLEDDAAAWDGIKNLPKIGDMPFWMGDGGLGQSITGTNIGDPDPGLDPIDTSGLGLIGGSITYNPNLNNQVMIQQVIPNRTGIDGLPPWYPEEFTNLNMLLSQLLLAGEFVTTVSEHYVVDLDGSFTWTAGELDSDYISSQPLTEDLWVEKKVIKISHLRLVLSWGYNVGGFAYPIIRPAPQGRYGHKLVVHNNNLDASEDLLVLGGASWSNPWTFGFTYGQDTPTVFWSTSFLFWVNDDDIHPFTATDMWSASNELYTLHGYDYRYVGNITYKWNPSNDYWEGSNTNLASFGLGTELSRNYAFVTGNLTKGKAFFGLAELNLPDNEDVFVVSGGLENVPIPPEGPGQFNEFYKDWDQQWSKFGIPVQIANTVHKLELIENNGWQQIILEDPSLAPNAYGATSLGLDNYRSLSINGQTEFQVGLDSQFTNVHVPDYSLASTNDTKMFDNVAWVDMPSDGTPNTLENLAFSATYDVRTTDNGVTTVYIYKVSGSDSATNLSELPNPVYTAQYIGPFIYGEDSSPNPGTSEFSVEPPVVLADRLHYATASGILRDYAGTPVAGKQIAVAIDDDATFPPIYDGDVKVLPMPDNLKVRAQDTPDMTVVVNAGYALFDNGSGGFKKVELSATNSAVFEQPILSDRIDLLVLTKNGLLDIEKGIEANPPIAPAVPNNTVVLAGIYIRYNQTEILDLDDTIANFITDARSDDLKFGAGNSPGQSGYSEKFVETDASGSFQFRLSSTVVAQHKVWLYVNISTIPNADWFIKIGSWDVEFILDGVPSRLSTIVADPNHILANGVESSVITVTLLDGNGMPAPDYWVNVLSNRNKFATNGYISAFAEGSITGQTLVTSIDHGLPEGGNITISNTTNYDGMYTISNSNINTFEITTNFVDDVTGIWTTDLVDNITLFPNPNYPNDTDPISDINGQVKFIVNSRISGLAIIYGKYSLDEEGSSSNSRYIIDADVIEFGGYISGLEPGYGRQGQALEYIIATGAQTNWDSATTEVKFIAPGEISFQTGNGDIVDNLRIIANGNDSIGLKIIASDYPNADLELTILDGSGNFFGTVPTSLNGFGEAIFIYTSGNQAGIVKILAKINGGLLAGGIEEELWFIEDEPIAHNYELEIAVANPHLDENVNVTEVRSAIWMYAGSTKVIVDNQTNSFDFSSDDDGQFNPNPADNNSLGVATTTYTKDTADGRAHIFVEVDFKPNPTDPAIHLMASQLINKESTGLVDEITIDSLTVIDAEKIDLGGETNANNHVHISENARIGLWTISIYTPNVDSGPFDLSMDETVQYPFIVLPAGPSNGSDPRIVSIQPWYGVFGETQKVVDIIGVNTTFASNYYIQSIVAFTATDVGQPSDAITVNSVEVISQTHLRATITISEETASLGWYNVSVTTVDEVAIKPGDQDFLVTGDSNFALHLYSNVNEVPRDGQSQASITAGVVFIDPTDGSVSPVEDVAITFDHSDAGPVQPPTLSPLETTTNNLGLAYSLYTTDAGDENELIDITATATVYPISGDPIIISNKISILKIVYSYSGFVLSANPDSLPLYGSPNYSALTAEGLPSGDNISVWFSQIMGKGYVVPLQTSTNTGMAITRYYSASEGERIPETIEIEAFAIVPGIGIVKSNSALIQIGEDDADYKLNLTAAPNEVTAGGLISSDITAALSFLNQPSSNWPISFELIQEQAGDYLTKNLVWTEYPSGLAQTKFVPGYIAGIIMVRARPLGLNIVKDVVITKTAEQNPDEYLTTITAVPRYVPTSNDGSDFSIVTVTVRNENFTPLENVTVQLTTDRLADTIRLSDGSINNTTSTNEDGQAIFRVSSTLIGVSLVEAIVSTFSVSTDIVFEDPALLTSRFLDVRVPFQSRDYDNLTWIYVTEETTLEDPLVFTNEVYTKLAKPDDRLSVLANIKMYFHLDKTYNLWAKGRNHLSRVDQFFPGDKTGEGETLVIDMTRTINNKDYGLFVADLKPDLRDNDGTMVPSPFHDNAVNVFDFNLLITNFYQNHYTANINWPLDEIVNNFDVLFVFLNWGNGEGSGPYPYE